MGGEMADKEKEDGEVAHVEGISDQSDKYGNISNLMEIFLIRQFLPILES